MTTRSASFRHVRFTRRSREPHANADQKPLRAYPERVQSQTVSQAPAQDALPLAGFYRLYEAQLRAERKSPNTIRNYNEALGKFSRWLEMSYGRPPLLAEYNAVEPRLFLADARRCPERLLHT